MACRTAGVLAARAVLCLAFPLVPPRAVRPADRGPELDAVGVPVLVVQGERDPFGCPAARGGRDVVVVRGDHSLRAEPEAVGTAVAQWLAGVLTGG